MKRTPLAALATLVVVACAGCSDDPEPDFAPPESTSPTSPTPTDPTTTATTPEKLSPEETVRAWVEAQNLALQTGDSSRVRSLGQRCPSCDDFIEPVERTYEAGGRYETAGWQIDSITTERQAADTAQVAGAITFAGGKRVPEQGADPVRFGPEKHVMVFELVKASAAWQVKLVGFVP